LENLFSPKENQMTKRKDHSARSVRSSNALSEAEKLVNAHFDNYVAKLITLERSVIGKILELSDEHLALHLKIVEFHYKSAGVHFYKHGWEAGYAKGIQDATERAEQASQLREDRAVDLHSSSGNLSELSPFSKYLSRPIPR
jgi:hypothetical protein